MRSEIQLLVMTHGDLGKELIKTASLFVPNTDTIGCIGLYEDDAITDVQSQMESIVTKQKCVLILTDMVSAATTRVAAQALRYGEVEVLSGVNLVMLITAQREKENYDIKTLCNMVCHAAKGDIVDIRKRLHNEG